ncbi:anti-sigma F factor [Hydrogenibacillus schlegelii]|uniref:Anti-sigma F factor n=1 Tax=Hydrogenibacillus schlegelii TaxID=1484 RepID=A0A132N4Y2_HYDSH|nr:MULTISPECIES: anti-sigma F factor [Hydrogenibacillus]KWX05188.1 hypothetical protein TR75_07960 [Hydrogenibacillus schlegelii]OAR03206.1 anti-sigma F factor [Hydrogenibacillus schlegelii]PTQ53699.1 MAG: Anti-sigma F factor [Hydrogenibacillus schlegelii]QZA32002.1 anti-sigma F factor [Hydrogenibacillus sp. N12]
MARTNAMTLVFPARSGNESLARVAVAAFAAALDPTVEELDEIKTAVSEAVTNAIIHGYPDRDEPGEVVVRAWIDGDVLTVVVEDQGAGIADVAKAREPLYTTRPDLERSGMGFTIMENFMDDVEVESAPGRGTRVRMVRRIKSSAGAPSAPAH